MSNIDKCALREAAEKATPGRWEYYPGNTSIEYNVDSMVEDQGSIVYVDSGDFTQKQTDLNGTFIAAANPATVLALLDELEVATDACNGWQRKFAEADERLQAAEKRIAELENDEVRQRLANAEQQLHIAELEKYNLRARSKAQFRKRKAAELRVAELEAVKFKLSDPKLLSLAKDIVENLVDTGGSDPEYTQQYVDWTFKRIRAAAGKGE